MGCPHAAAKATEAAAAEAAEATTAAARRIAGTPTHGYAATRDGGFLPRVGDGTQGPRNLRACFFVPYSEASVSWLPISKFIARSGRLVLIWIWPSPSMRPM